MRKAWTVTVDASGNVIVAGSWREDEGRLFVAKLDAQGRVLWRRILERDAPPWGFVSEPAEDRDSFEPQMLDDIAAFEQKLARGRKLQRTLAVGIAAALVTLSLAGGVGATHAARARTPAARTAIAERVRGMPITRTAYVDEIKLVPGPSATELREQTVQLLSQGKPADALPLARAFVATDPEDAFAHLCLGSALLDLGRRDEARATFRQCVEQAKRGNVDECRALSS